jgi:HEAT repeat protein
LKYLESWNPAIRAFAIQALGKIKDPVAVRPLLEILIKEPNADVIDALGEIGDPQVVSFLDQFTASKVWRLRFSTANALKKIGGEAVVPLLSYMLGDSDENVADVASEGLGMSGSGLAVSSLLDALQRENNQKLRTAIVNALATLYKSQKLGEREKISILQMKEQLDAWHHDKPVSIHVDQSTIDDRWEHTDRYDHEDLGVRISLE